MTTATETKPDNGAVTQPRPAQGLAEYVPFGSRDAIKLSVNIVRDMIAVPTKKGALPDDRQCLRFIALCRSQALNPFAGDAYLIGYETNDGPQFSLVTAHQAFIKRAETHGEFDGMTSGVIIKDAHGDLLDREGDFLHPGDELLGGWAVVHFKTRKHPMHKRLNVGSRKKNFGQWLSDTAGMIVKCAEVDALRASFPTLLGGLYTEGELLGPSAPREAAPRPVEQVRQQLAGPAEKAADETLMLAIQDEIQRAGLSLDEQGKMLSQFGYTNGMMTQAVAEQILRHLQALPDREPGQEEAE